MTARQMIERTLLKKLNWEAACKTEAKQATRYKKLSSKHLKVINIQKDRITELEDFVDEVLFRSGNATLLIHADQLRK